MTLQDTLARSREIARTAGDHAADMFAPLVTIGRGLRSHVRWAHARWTALPKERRLPTLFVTAAVVAGVVMLPYGPLIAVVTLMGSAAWAGRDRTPPPEPGPDTIDLKLGSLYSALTPYLSAEADPEPLYRHGSSHEDYHEAFSNWEFDEEGRLTKLDLKYPAYFTDTEPHARARIEHVVHGKAGRSREYRFEWDLETNRLHVEALAALPTDIAAQRFVTSPGEVVLGFTDPASSNRTIPVRIGGGTEPQHPVLWRTGPRATEPHLLALGTHRHGTSTLLRSIALQALAWGDVVVIDGAGTGEHACLVGRPGVHTVETSLHGALAALEWAANETSRRLGILNQAKHSGDAPPPDVLRPLWLLLDQPAELTELAQAEGRPDPQDLLESALRHGRTARVTVVVAEHLEALDRIRPSLRAACRARLVLGALDPDLAPEALGVPLDITPADHTPPGRGYARVGGRTAVRVQVPDTPDPLDEDTSPELREAVVALLPFHDTRTEAPAPDLRPAGGLPPEDLPPGGPADGRVSEARGTGRSPSDESATADASGEDTAETAEAAEAEAAGEDAAGDEVPLDDRPAGPAPTDDELAAGALSADALATDRLGPDDLGPDALDADEIPTERLSAAAHRDRAERTEPAERGEPGERIERTEQPLGELPPELTRVSLHPLPIDEPELEAEPDAAPVRRLN